MAPLSVIRPAAVRLSATVGRISPAPRGYATAAKAGGKESKDAAMKTTNRSFKKKNAANPGPGGKKDLKSGVFFPMSDNVRRNLGFDGESLDELNLLPTFHPERLTVDSAGQAMKFGMASTDAMRVFGLPKNLLVEFRILSKPVSVVRDVTLNILERLDAASQQSSQNTRLVLTGTSGSGKSFTLVQAVQYACENDWLVFYFPRAVNTVNSTTSYVYDPRTQVYLQPVYAYQTLHRFLTVNAGQLQKLSSAEEIHIDKKPTMPKGTPLTDLIAVGIKDQTAAPAVLSALLNELGNQKQFPVLMAIDDFQALYCKTAYRDPQFDRINSYHMSMPRMMLEYASGKKTFARGAVVGAISTGNMEYRTTLELQEALDLSPGPSSPYLKRSPDLVSYTQGLTKIPVPEELSMKEAASLFDVWMKDRALVGAQSDETFLTKYTEAGGNARAFVWKGLLSSLSTT